MGTIDDVKGMKKEGKSEQEISESLKQRGFSEREAREVISQATIKDAVSLNNNGAFNSGGDFSGEEYQPSISSQPTSIPQQGTGYPSEQTQGQYMGGDYSGGAEEYNTGYPGPAGGAYTGEAYSSGGDYGAAYGSYPEYQNYQGGMSSDVITEIAEQIVSEKLSGIRDRLEKTIDFRTTAESMISNLNERLRRIEQILDRLQLSLLQKMGEYVTDVKDIKNEMEETQKSFKALSHKKGHRKHP